MSNLVSIKAEEADKGFRSEMDSIIATPAIVGAWRKPDFQRELTIDGGVMSGVITPGRIGVKKDAPLYVVDGQHRIAGFNISELPDCYMDVRICSFANMAEMAAEFVRLIRERCPFIGYEHIRRGAETRGAILSMAVALRSWAGSASETPVGNNGAGGRSAAQYAAALTEPEALQLISFLEIAHKAWGPDPQYFRLWIALNLTMCMWLYRRLVLDRERGVKRYVLLTAAQFKKCLMALSASSEYIDWLRGRLLGENDRSPCYRRMKVLFNDCLREDLPGAKILMPAPSWHTN